MPSSSKTPPILSEQDKAHFLQHGWIKVPKCFTRTQATHFTADVWTRLGMSPKDKSTWTSERVNMPWHDEKTVLVSDFAPKAWSAMCELLGGEERISERMRNWNNGFIVNLGLPEYRSEDEVIYRELDNWHNDGDFFVHFLDSPEQALLVIPLWSDISPKGGGTAICGDGIKHIAKHLYNHPEGVTPWMLLVNDPKHVDYEGTDFWTEIARDPSKTRDEAFLDATGEVGDVYLLHPFMLHSASKNLLRTPRIITNPLVSLKEPFNFDRKDKSEYSIVEQKTLNDLGMPDGLKGWAITKERMEWVPKRVKRMEEMKRAELERLKDLSQIL